jgi:hypothetical protein
MSAPVYTFLPWIRRGASAALGSQNALGSAVDGRVSLMVTMKLNASDVTVPMTLYGPGDASAIDRRVIRRLEPSPGTREAEPFQFASIDFSTPDLPWVLTPAGPSAGDRLDPWVALVVVPAATSQMTPPAGSALARLTVASNLLQDPNELWAWAHAQLVGTLDRPIAQILNESPQLLSSRLLSPRRLDPGVSWRACVVPVFAAGRDAGLGVETPPTHPLDFAWTIGTDSPVTLPVYYSWEFTTAADADFETLARRLHPRELPTEVGKLPVDFRTPGYGVRGVDLLLNVDGSLRPLQEEDEDLPANAWGTRQDLERAVNLGAEPETVTAPLYGGTYANVTTLPASGWLRELNTDPRMRAIAGIGAEIVRRNQEALMNSAWEQLGAAREANRLIRWLVLAQNVVAALYRKHYQPLPTDGLVTITGPIQTRMRLQPGGRTTLAYDLQKNLRVLSATTALFRRSVRREAPLARVRREVTARVRRIDIGILPDVAEEVIDLPAPTGTMVTLQRVFDALGRPANLTPMLEPNLTEAAIVAVTTRRRFSIVDEMGSIAPNPAPTDQSNFRAAARAYLAQMERILAITARVRPGRFIFPIDRAQFLAALDPVPRFRAIAGTRILTAPGGPPRAELDPVRGTPTFPAPTFYALRDVASQHILPGLEYVPANTISLLVACDRFIEAFLVGMNHEFDRELLWREFPCQRGGTFFRRFWDRRDAAAATGDISEIAFWTIGSALGSHVDPAGVQTVLLIRGDLVRRFPGATVYSVPRTTTGRPDLDPATETYPIFRGGLEPDLVFLGFPFPREEARQRFFILQQQPGAPRFGLDEESAIPVASVTSRNDLAWTHMPEGAIDATIAGPLQGRVLADSAANATWGKNSADMAWLTLQLPVRVILPGSEMVPA